MRNNSRNNNNNNNKLDEESCNFILNELHDCMITQAFITNALSLRLDESDCQNVNTRAANNKNDVTMHANNANAKLKNVPDVFAMLNNTINETNTTIQPVVQVAPAPTQCDSLYSPRDKDTLFWCLYIIMHGVCDYEMNNQPFLTEKHEKIKSIELLRTKKSLLKQHKIKPLTEIENDLANNPTISVKTFFAIAIINGFNVMYVHNNVYYEFIADDDNEKIHIIHQFDNFKTGKYINSRFAYEQEPTVEKINKYRSEYYKMISIDKPVNTIVSYKISELLELSEKLNVVFANTTNKKLTKKEIYDGILMKF